MAYSVTQFTLLLLLLVLFVFGNVAGMRTAPPDEIIEILSSGDYNKHHLPTYAANSTVRSRNVLHGPNGWTLSLEHYQKADYERIRLNQKEKASGRPVRVEMTRMVARQLQYQLARFINHYLVKEDGEVYVTEGYSNQTNLHSNVYSSERENLINAEIRTDPHRIYYVNFIRKDNGKEQLLITEARGRFRRATVLIPSSHWQNVSQALNDFLETSYSFAQGPPTNVTIGLYIEGMSSFRAQTMDFHVDIYFSETWVDRRLRHSSAYPALLRDMSLYEQMWHPDLYFANAKEARYHTVTAANFLVYIFPNGTIYLDIRISLVVNCMMDLSHYPLDQQECFIRILSYAYDKDNLNILWKPVENITKNDEIKLPDMDLVNYEAQYCNGTYAIGTWACARASFKMKREIMHHVLQSYIPTALIVVISWFSFWLDVDAVPGRVSLCITTLLTLATQAQAAKMSLPQVAYAKAIDVWMGTCMGFVFGVMIEFTVVNYISRRTPKSAAELELKRKRTCSSSRLLPSRTSVTPNASTRFGEFHNLLFDVTTLSDDPRFSPSAQEDRAIGYGGTNHRGKECNGCPRYSLANREPSISYGATDPSQNPPEPEQKTQVQKQQAQRNRKLAIAVDRVSRFIFPCSFILFNMLYWPYYLLPRM